MVSVARVVVVAVTRLVPVRIAVSRFGFLGTLFSHFIFVIIHFEGSGINGARAGAQIVTARNPENVVHGVLSPSPAFWILGLISFIEKVSLQGVVDGHVVLAEGVGVGVGVLGHVNAAVAGRVLAHLLNGSWALWSFAYPSRQPFVAAHVHDVLDHEADADWHVLVVGSLL